jgi:hypothetical protein
MALVPLNTFSRIEIHFGRKIYEIPQRRGADLQVVHQSSYASGLSPAFTCFKAISGCDLSIRLKFSTDETQIENGWKRVNRMMLKPMKPALF